MGVARLTRQPQSPAEAAETMRAHNPAVIPRNHKVEEALAAAVNGDLSVMHHLLDALADPYRTATQEEFTTRPPPGAEAYQTFCGT